MKLWVVVILSLMAIQALAFPVQINLGPTLLLLAHQREMLLQNLISLPTIPDSHTPACHPHDAC